MKSKVLGHGAHELREARILNRVVRVTANGWEYEADQRHADLIIKELGLEEAKPAAAPGSKEEGRTKEEHSKALDIFLPWI